MLIYYIKIVLLIYNINRWSCPIHNPHVLFLNSIEIILLFPNSILQLFFCRTWKNVLSNGTLCIHILQNYISKRLQHFFFPKLSLLLTWWFKSILHNCHWPKSITWLEFFIWNVLYKVELFSKPALDTKIQFVSHQHLIFFNSDLHKNP